NIKAYPTRESGELVWAYLGPRDEMPAELPQLEFALLPATHRYVTKRLQQCNWAQSVEGGLDTAHFSFLHMPAPTVKSYANPATAADESRLRWLRDDPLPEFTLIEYDVGFAEQDALAQDSQGVIADRTREHLTATDAAVVRWRRLMLDAARALAAGHGPEAPRRAASYRTRAGGALAPSRLSFAEVMRQ